MGWLTFVLGLIYLPTVAFYGNRWEQRHPVDDDAWAGALDATGGPVAIPDPILQEGQAAVTFTALLVRSPGTLGHLAVAFALAGAGFIPAFLIDGSEGMKGFLFGGVVGIVVPLAGLLAYGQLVWWRTGAWPQQSRRRRRAATTTWQEVEPGEPDQTVTRDPAGAEHAVEPRDP